MTITSSPPYLAPKPYTQHSPSKAEPAAHEKPHTEQIRQQLKELSDLHALVIQSPHKSGFPRVSKDGVWKFSGERSWLETLHLRKTRSGSAINAAGIKLVGRGERIKRSMLEQRLRDVINSYPVTLKDLETPRTTPPIATPRKSSPPVEMAKPTVAPRTVFPDNVEPRKPIPALRSDLSKFQKVMDNYISSPALSIPSTESGTASVKARVQALEARSRV